MTSGFTAGAGELDRFGVACGGAFEAIFDPDEAELVFVDGADADLKLVEITGVELVIVDGADESMMNNVVLLAVYD